MLESESSTEQLDNPLALESQICFALAVASRSVIGAYRSVLDPLHLTHPQYLVMLALWQHGRLPVRRIAEMLRLEPATVSPLVKRLEALDYVTRTRSAADERIVEVDLPHPRIIEDSGVGDLSREITARLREEISRHAHA